MVESLNRDEVWVLLDAPDPTTAAGVRDRAMLHLTYAAGLRVSELIGLMYTDLARPHLDTVRVTGKGRRERVLPLWKETRAALRDWLCVRPDTGQDHLFLNARGKAMTRHGFAHRLELHATTARQRMPSMTGKRIFPHLLRHSCAAHTLEATGDIRKVVTVARPRQHPEYGDLPAQRPDREARGTRSKGPSGAQKGLVQAGAGPVARHPERRPRPIEMVSDSGLAGRVRRAGALQLSITVRSTLMS